jgi:hypothetical protein
MRKVLVGLMALAVAALTAGSASAIGGFGGVQVDVGNCASVGNNISAVSNSGSNTIVDIAKGGSYSAGNNAITTGNTDATAGAANLANSNLSSSFCCGGAGVQVDVGNMAMVGNTVSASSQSGFNEIVDVAKYGSANGGNNKIDTGNADATAGAVTVANSNLKSGWGGKKQIDKANFGMVYNDVDAQSNTGSNKIVDVAECFSGSAGSNTILTGEATTLAGSITVINSNITRSF